MIMSFDLTVSLLEYGGYKPILWENFTYRNAHHNMIGNSLKRGAGNPYDLANIY